MLPPINKLNYFNNAPPSGGHPSPHIPNEGTSKCPFEKIGGGGTGLGEVKDSI